MREYIYEITKDFDGVDCYIKREEIVRCKDCKHVRTFDVNPDRYHCEFTPAYTHCASGFCEKGERRDYE